MEQVAHWNTHYSVHSLSALSTVNDFSPSFLYLSLLNNKLIPCLAQLRNHLNNAIKHQGQPNAVNLTNPETLQLHLETRLAQLESAINMELWQVCHIIREKQSLHSEALNSACSCSVNGIFTNSLNSSSLCCRYSTGHRHCSTYMHVNCVQYGGFPRKIHAKNLRVNFNTSFYTQTFYTQIWVYFYGDWFCLQKYTQVACISLQQKMWVMWN